MFFPILYYILSVYTAYIFVRCFWHRKLPQIWHLNDTDFLYHTFGEQVSYQFHWAVSKVSPRLHCICRLKGEVFSWLDTPFGEHWLSSAWYCTAPISASVLMLPFPLLYVCNHPLSLSYKDTCNGT